jgi:hypothetical protein
LHNKKTLSQLKYPDEVLPKVNDPNHWSKRYSSNFLRLVWQGIDLFSQDFSTLDLSKATLQIERSFCKNLELRIRRVMSGEEPFDVQHESWEDENANSQRPSQYEIAFIMRDIERLSFPIEVKVLKTDGQVSEYVKDVNEAFIPCVYAPFSYEGAMLSYLLLGTSQKAFQNIAKSLNSTLKQHPEFPNRPHKFSEHDRQVPQGKEELYPSKFRCHHLIFQLSEDKNNLPIIKTNKYK